MKVMLVLAVFLLLTACQQPDTTQEGIRQEVHEEEQQSVQQQENEAYVMKKDLIEFSTFPAAEQKELGEGRYAVEFETDYQVQFVMYNEERYKEWKELGIHTIAKINTREGSSCCKQKGSYKIDVNEGEGGLYYFVFDTSQLSKSPKVGKLSVKKI